MKIRLFRSIRYKLICCFILVSLIPFTYIGYEGIISARNSLTNNTLQEIFLDAYSKARDIENYLNNAKADLLYLRGLPALGYFLEADSLGDKPSMTYWRTLLEKGFFNFLNQKRNFSKIAYLDEEGNEVIITLFENKRMVILPMSGLYNQKENRYFQEGSKLREGEIAVVPLRNYVEKERDLKEVPLLRFITKVIDMNGRFKGIIYFDITGHSFFGTMTRSAGRRPLRALLVERDGNFIFRPQGKKSGNDTEQGGQSPFSNVSIKETFSRVVVSQLLSGRPGIIEDQEDYLFAYAPIFSNHNQERPAYVVVYPFPRRLVMAGVMLFKKLFYTAGVAVALVTIFIGILVSGRLTRPLLNLKKGVQRFGKGDLNHRLQILSGDEIEAVAKEFNEMATSLTEYRDSLERKIEDRTKEIKRYQKQLFHSEKMAAMGVLASGVAHEINNPMGIIINRIECVKMENPGNRLPEQVQKDLDTIRHHATRVSNIAGNLLSLARKRSHELSEHDLHQVLDRVLSLMGRHLAKRNIVLKKEFSPSLLRIRADSGGLEQVFLNLIKNAAEAMGQAGGTILIRSEYNSVEKNVSLTFQDTGPGVPKEYREKIFDPFFSTKEPGKGIGLGLYISYTIIEEHDGTIEVENNNGQGASFRVILPVAT